MDEIRCAVIYLIIIYLFNRFHHGYSIMKRLGLNIHLDKITRRRDDGDIVLNELFFFFSFFKRINCK